MPVDANGAIRPPHQNNMEVNMSVPAVPRNHESPPAIPMPQLLGQVGLDQAMILTPQGDKHVWRDFPADAFGPKVPTERDAVRYLVAVKRIASPSSTQISETVEAMKQLEKSIYEEAKPLVRNKCGELAQKQGMPPPPDDWQKVGPSVTSFELMRRSFRVNPTYKKCRQVFDVLYFWPDSLHGKKWINDQVKSLKQKFHLGYPDVNVCFVRSILVTKCLGYVREQFQVKARRKSDDEAPIGVNGRKCNLHPMGKGDVGRHFQPQYISNWEYLVQVCEEARGLYDDYLFRTDKMEYPKKPIWLMEDDEMPSTISRSEDEVSGSNSRAGEGLTRQGEDRSIAVGFPRMKAHGQHSLRDRTNSLDNYLLRTQKGQGVIYRGGQTAAACTENGVVGMNLRINKVYADELSSLKASLAEVGHRRLLLVVFAPFLPIKGLHCLFFRRRKGKCSRNNWTKKPMQLTLTEHWRPRPTSVPWRGKCHCCGKHCRDSRSDWRHTSTRWQKWLL